MYARFWAAWIQDCEKEAPGILDLGSRAEEKKNPRGFFFPRPKTLSTGAQEAARPYVRKVLGPRRLQNLMYVRFRGSGGCNTLCTEGFGVQEAAKPYVRKALELRRLQKFIYVWFWGPGDSTST